MIDIIIRRNGKKRPSRIRQDTIRALLFVKQRLHTVCGSLFWYQVEYTGAVAADNVSVLQRFAHKFFLVQTAKGVHAGPGNARRAS